MVVNKPAEYAAKVKKEYMIIGHCKGYAIVKDEIDNLFCVTDNNKVLEEGCVCEASGLVPVEQLPEMERKAILQWYENGVK